MDETQISALSAQVWSARRPGEDLVGRLAQALRAQIGAEGTPPGTRLPGEAELARRLGISRSTLREATRRLAQDGLLDIRHGVGTFVAGQARPLTNALDTMASLTLAIRAAGAVPGVRALAIERIAAPADVASQLGLAAGTPVAAITRVRLADARPLALAHEYVPLFRDRDFAVLQGFDGASLYAFLVQSLGRPLLRSDMSVTAIGANEHQARLLQVKRRAPLLAMREIHYDDAERRVLYSVNFHNTAVVEFTLQRAGLRT